MKLLLAFSVWNSVILDLYIMFHKLIVLYTEIIDGTGSHMIYHNSPCVTFMRLF
jgi:hypothetical protein